MARAIVLRLLAVRARTREELSRALAAKNVPPAAAVAVLDRMQEVGLVDDESFAADWVESRQQRRHLSKVALRRELQGKGVDRDEVETALGTVQEADEYEAALALAERKHQVMAGLPREVRYRRLAGMLARRGFGGGLVSQVLAKVLDATETSQGSGPEPSAHDGSACLTRTRGGSTLQSRGNQRDR